MAEVTTTEYNKPCTTVHPMMVGVQSDPCKPLPRMFFMDRILVNNFNAVVTGLHIDSQVSRNSHMILSPETPSSILREL